ncbi:hypothetical protein [Variovorax ginsengisoli]|uniref:Uncharacterized protein n=1 Tax=Variovorax ginsengisoli TaxID=363844 RepID=A0ABT8SDJ7_9BURK|nr:hypothetical protein [Variovorax ginsengisoli]MDN8617824.1 hypothetical protein [Variovorax ginsengisoli]MDO1536994.1 hypothetical protein [Variovorax ginsengisoli]
MNDATKRAIVRNQELAAAFGAVLPPAPLTARPRLVGTVDATRDRREATPRSLDEAFGPGARNTVVVPMDADEFTEADALVIRWSLRCAMALVLILTCEWLFL